MSDKMKGLHLLAQRQSRGADLEAQRQQLRQKVSSTLQAAIERGRAQGREEMALDMEKLSSFRGQVAAHAASSEMIRIKASAMQGLCYRCHTNPVDPNTQDSRCARCSEGV